MSAERALSTHEPLRLSVLMDLSVVAGFVLTEKISFWVNHVPG